MAQKQKLLTYNPKKNPLVEEFFKSIEDGMQSHRLREAIEFYMAYKNKVDASVTKEEVLHNVSGSDKGHQENDHDQIQDDNNYEDFNPGSL